MPTMKTTYGNGGIQTDTSAPMAGASGAFDANALGALLARQLQRKLNPPGPAAPPQQSYVAPPSHHMANGGGTGGGGDMENVYVQPVPSGVGINPGGWTEVAPGTPGAVFAGTRPKGSGGNGAGAKNSGGGGREPGPPKEDPSQDYVSRQTAAAKQQDDGKFSVALPGTTYGVDFLR